MKDVFKETIILAPPGEAGEVEMVLRPAYKRYIGSFVLHGHILYHEDLGMMRNLRIIAPGHVDFTIVGRAGAPQH